MSTISETEAHGPVDFALLEFPRDRLTGEAGQALMDLVEAGTIRLFDLLVIAKDADGGVQVLELTDPGGPAEGFSYFAGARSGLLGDEDVAGGRRGDGARHGRRPAGLREHLGGAVRRRRPPQRWAS